MTPYTELTTDPAALGYAPFVSARNDQKLYDLLHAITTTKLGWISVSDFDTWLAGYDAEFANMKTLAATPASQFYGDANILMSRMSSSDPRGAIDLSDPNVMAMVNTWPFVDTTGAAKAALIALGTYPASRADVLPFSCDLSDISNSLNRGY